MLVLYKLCLNFINNMSEKKDKELKKNKIKYPKKRTHKEAFGELKVKRKKTLHLKKKKYYLVKKYLTTP